MVFITAGIKSAICLTSANSALFSCVRGNVSVVIFVTVGAILGGLGLYKYLIDFAGAGATVPLTGFGANLAKGALESVKEVGLLGAFIGGVKANAGGIAAAIFFGYLASLIAKPKIKKQ